jgi:hypothetical protein
MVMNGNKVRLCKETAVQCIGIQLELLRIAMETLGLLIIQFILNNYPRVQSRIVKLYQLARLQYMEVWGQLPTPTDFTLKWKKWRSSLE